MSISGNKSFSANKNHILILAGGAGSGKSFYFSNVIGFSGKTFNVDDLKSRLEKLGKESKSKESEQFRKDFKQKTGIDIRQFDMGNPKHVSAMHNYVKKKDYDFNSQISFLKSVEKLEEKPNVIFDVTLKNTEKFEDILAFAELGGYDKKNIHICWILNKLEVAWQQNLKRKRVVKREVFLDTHSGASETFERIISNFSQYRSRFDGDMFICFNQKGIDISFTDEHGKPVELDKKNGNVTVSNYDAFQVKKQGKPPISTKDFEKAILDKVKDYVPEPDVW